MDEIINKFTKKSEDKPTSSNSSKFDELYNQSAILEKHKQFVKPRLAVSLNSSYNWVFWINVIFRISVELKI